MIFHRLEFEAFMAYPGREVIDFDSLNDAGIFLLNGPTGSGKTTILDAICYALYGLPSSGRETGSLYSTHVTPGTVKPHIFLELSIQNHRLRIDRTPSYRRLITRGKNKGAFTVENPQALVSELKAGEDPYEEKSWRKAAEGMADSAEYLMRLIGLNREQFLKVMLLPQGQFADFLKARSKDRIPLLKQLFPVETYEQITNKLREKEQSTEHAVLDLKRTVERILEQSVAAYTKLRRQLSLDTDNAGSSSASAVDGEHPEPQTEDLAAELESARTDFESWATERLQHLQQQQQRDEQSLSDLKEKREKLAAQHQTITQQIQDWAEYENLRASWARLETHQEEHHQQRRALDNARAAAPVNAELDRSRDEEKRRMRAAETLRSALRITQEHAACALQSLGDSSNCLESSLYRMSTVQELPQIASEASSALVKLRVYQQDEQTLRELKTTLAALEHDVEKAQRDVESYAVREQQNRHKLTEITGRINSLQEIEQEYAHAQNTLETAEKTQQEVTSHNAKLDQAQASYEKASQEYELAQRASIAAAEEYAGLQRRRLEQAAFTLAEELKEGEACMVCGSREHPHPAQASVSGITLVEQPEIDAAEKRAHLEQKKASAAASTMAQARTVVEQLGDSELPTLREAQQLAAEAKKAYLNAQKGLETKRKALRAHEKITAELQEMSEKQIQARTAWSQARARQTETQKRMTGLEEKLKRVSAAVNFADRVRLLEAYIEQARHADDAAHRLEDAAARAVESAQRADQILERSVFDTFDAVRQAVLSDSEQRDLEKDISAYREELLTLQAALDRPAMRLIKKRLENGQTAPTQEQLDQLRQERHDAEERYDSLLAREGIRTNGIETLETLCQEYQERMSDSAQAVKQANLYSGLARIARGDNPDKDHQIDLVSYVLGGEFEQVLRVASEHLWRMSDNRYRLILSDKREKRARVGGGLSISVEDSWNNDQREVSSLSGGESFLASLSLALGLAEVVQARNGGIEIETLFIDEGFGTLDSETLELVMETLDNIHENGRVVGLISHVENMKERISAQVSIEKRQNGSILRVNV